MIGHGLNAQELQANPRLDRHWVQNLNTNQSLPLEVQNLNTNQTLPLEDDSVDYTLIVAGWQYLQPNARGCGC